MRASRILVTGGAGYIGSVVSAQLLAAGHTVVVVDDLSTGHADAVPPGAEFHHLGITELAGGLPNWGIEAVIHFAAKSLVGESTRGPALYWHNNVVGTLALLDAMRGAGVPTIVFSSTAATYGEVQSQPISENAPTRPTSPYGASKLAIDLALADYAAAYGLAAVSLRYFNVAGALQTEDRRWYGERHATETHLIPNALSAVRDIKQSPNALSAVRDIRQSPNALSAARDIRQSPDAVKAVGGFETGHGPSSTTLKLFGTDYPTPDGTCVRDYIHVVDLADAHIRALAAAQAGRHHIVNLGSGTGSSVREVLDTVGEVTGTAVPVLEADRRAGDPPVLIASNARAAELLGWRPQLDLRRMVADAWSFLNS